MNEYQRVRNIAQSKRKYEVLKELNLFKKERKTLGMQYVRDNDGNVLNKNGQKRKSIK